MSGVVVVGMGVWCGFVFFCGGRNGGEGKVGRKRGVFCPSLFFFSVPFLFSLFLFSRRGDFLGGREGDMCDDWSVCRVEGASFRGPSDLVFSPTFLRRSLSSFGCSFFICFLLAVGKMSLDGDCE